MIRLIDGMNRAIGEAMAWMMIPIVVIAASVVVLRYGFGLGFIWLQELFVWMHGVAFMLGAGFVLGTNGHVRVDALYRKVSERGRAIINIVGSVLFLFPSMIVIAVISLPMVESSWRIMEKSSNIQGLPFAYLVKTAIIGFCLVVGLQGLSLFMKSVLLLCGDDRFAEAQAPETQDDIK